MQVKTEMGEAGGREAPLEVTDSVKQTMQVRVFLQDLNPLISTIRLGNMVVSSSTSTYMAYSCPFHGAERDHGPGPDRQRQVL